MTKGPCPKCQAKGGIGTFGPCLPRDIHYKQACPNCKGKCQTKRLTPCSHCKAKGGFGVFGACELHDIHYKKPCEKCDGKGYLKEEKKTAAVNHQSAFPQTGFSIFSHSSTTQTKQQLPQAQVYTSTQWPSGVFYVRSKFNGLFLDAKGEGKSNGTDIIQWTSNKQRNQQWSFEQGGIIRNVHNGLVIDIKEGSDIYLWTYGAKASQQWNWDGKHISSMTNGHVLDVKGCSSKPGVEIVLWQANGGANQQWELIRV